MSVSATTLPTITIPPFSSKPHPTKLQAKPKCAVLNPKNRPRCAVQSPNAPQPYQALSMEKADALMRPIQGTGPHSPVSRTGKITVVGVGNVGMAIAQTILTQDLTDDLALLDIQPDKLRGEMLDLQHAAAFLPRTKITADTDYAVTAGSDLCVITAGARQRQGESRLDLLHRNLALFKSIVPQLVKHSPEALLMVVSNPVDVLSYITWKLSGLPPNRVVGSGTNLDSSRLRFSIAEQLNVNAQDVQALIVGEHGDSSVALWSTAAIGGVPLLSFLETQQRPFPLDVLHQGVINGAYEVIKLKGYTSWAVGYSAASLARSVLRNQRRIHPVSVLAKGFHGIEDEVFLSLPALLGRGGVLGVAEIPLTSHENERLLHSANTILQVQRELAI
ncbi:hypothetical protein SUGI_0782740 [Cryptomeria japonica]|uniref:L-lactate dehydrogenase B n=1 Tax=Cryptomeria japonica TaxID=3369 RepID=UPI00241479BC|nr:L-lactate dehydrogenase B [Cryptomeria japonica]GLJ38436.1 hypothetical protein SUGI_0782740 [Cryptomeria japonica]